MAHSHAYTGSFITFTSLSSKLSMITGVFTVSTKMARHFRITTPSNKDDQSSFCWQNTFIVIQSQFEELFAHFHSAIDILVSATFVALKL